MIHDRLGQCQAQIGADAGQMYGIDLGLSPVRFPSLRSCSSTWVLSTPRSSRWIGQSSGAGSRRQPVLTPSGCCIATSYEARAAEAKTGHPWAGKLAVRRLPIRAGPHRESPQQCDRSEGLHPTQFVGSPMTVPGRQTAGPSHAGHLRERSGGPPANRGAL